MLKSRYFLTVCLLMASWRPAVLPEIPDCRLPISVLWPRALKIKCDELSLNYDILKSTVMWESNGGKWWIIEYRKVGRRYIPISFGLLQISGDTVEDFLRCRGIRRVPSIRGWACDFQNNIDAACWAFRKNLNRHGSYLRALSEHNLGCRGYMRHAKDWRNGVRYYARYVHAIERRGRIKIKY